MDATTKSEHNSSTLTITLYRKFRKQSRDISKVNNWEVLIHLLYSPDLAPSYYLFSRSITHTLSKQHLQTYEVKK